MKNEVLYKTIIKFLNKNYGNLKPYETDQHPDYIFFMKDKQVIFDYNKENGRTYISSVYIWSFLERIFSMEYEQIQEVTKLWVEEHYNLRVTTTGACGDDAFKAVEEHYNLRVTTTLYQHHICLD
jgi:hypothetical protein